MPKAAMDDDRDIEEDGRRPAQPSGRNPMHHPEEQPSGTDEAPHFGRLLIVLAVAVLFIVLITYLSERYFSG